MIILVFAIYSFSQTASQEESIRVETNLTFLPVIVSDREGRYIDGLEKEDFHVFEDGIEQEIAFFDLADSEISVLLLLDVSSSMSPHFTNLTISANTLIRHLKAEDRVSVATFSETARFVFRPTRAGDLKKKFKIVSHFQEGGTYIYDGVDFGIAQAEKFEGRRALVIFSDGYGNGKFHFEKDNRRRALEGETIIYTVQYEEAISGEKIGSRYIKKAHDYMSNLATVTGGRHLQLKNIDDLEETFRQIALELRRTYTVGYYSNRPAKDGTPREVKVRVDRPGVSVRTRNEVVSKKSK